MNECQDLPHIIDQWLLGLGVLHIGSGRLWCEAMSVGAGLGVCG